ncbi:MAG: MopE-related protein, partial [Myxococcota bacterium]
MRATSFPGAVEVCNGFDDNCDGLDDPPSECPGDTCGDGIHHFTELCDDGNDDDTDDCARDCTPTARFSDFDETIR